MESPRDSADNAPAAGEDGENNKQEPTPSERQPELSAEEELRRISRSLALQPSKDPSGPSFYAVCNDIPSFAEAGGDIDDTKPLTPEEERLCKEMKLTHEALLTMRVQLDALKALRQPSAELLKDFFQRVGALSGEKLRRVDTQAGVQLQGDFYVSLDEKSDESIMKKVTRPKVLKEYPQYEMQHIRDALRFKVIVLSVADAFRFLALLIDETQWAERGVHAVKVDLKKMLKPKAFGWRFIGCDLKMPNGLLVECYIAFLELMGVDRGNHIFFEKWRGKDLDNLSAEERSQYEADAQESTRRYNQAFCEMLKRTTQNQFEALFTGFPHKMREDAVSMYKQVLFHDDIYDAEQTLRVEEEKLLDSAQSEKLEEGRQYIKTNNLEEAQKHFEGLIQHEQAKSFSPKELKTAKLLLASTFAKKALNRLKMEKFDEAVHIFEKVINDQRWCDTISSKSLKKLQLFQACAMYEAGKRHRQKGNMGEAKKCFEAAQDTNALPDELESKAAAYLQEYDEKTAVKEVVTIKEWLSLLGPTYAVYAEKFQECGYEDSNDLAEATRAELVEEWAKLGVEKKPHRRRILKGLHFSKKSKGTQC
eukprot:g2526.t1